MAISQANVLRWLLEGGTLTIQSGLCGWVSSTASFWGVERGLVMWVGLGTLLGV